MTQTRDRAPIATTAGRMNLLQDASKARQHVVFTPIAMVLLGVALPVFLVFNQISDGAYPEWPFAFVVAAYAGCRLAALVVSGEKRLYTFSFFLYCYLFLGLAPLVQLSRGSFPSVAPWVNAELNGAALGIVLAGMLSFDVGQWIQGRNRARAIKAGVDLVSLPALNKPRLYLLIAISLGVTFVFVLLVGPATFLQSRTEVFASIDAGVSYGSFAVLLRAAVVASLLVVFAATVALVKSRRGSHSFGLISLAVLLGTASLFITNVVNAPRYLAIVVMVGMLAALGIFATRGRIRIAFSAALAGFIFVFPILGGFRTSISFASATSDLEQVLLGGDYDSFAQINNALNFVNSEGNEFGRQLLGALFVWVPRGVWADKPTSTSTLVSEYMGYPFTNVSSPLWAELLVDFGMVGLVLGFVVLGLLFRRFDDKLELLSAAGKYAGVAGMIIPFYFVILLRGALLSTVPTLFVMLLCIAFITSGKRSSLIDMNDEGALERRPLAKAIGTNA
jgi:oligosaccharide repeat unit polymerase